MYIIVFVLAKFCAKIALVLAVATNGDCDVVEVVFVVIYRQ